MMGRSDIKGRRQDYIKNQQGEPHRIPLQNLTNKRPVTGNVKFKGMRARDNQMYNISENFNLNDPDNELVEAESPYQVFT